jgi:hypothetical protein
VTAVTIYEITWPDGAKELDQSSDAHTVEDFINVRFAGGDTVDSLGANGVHIAVIGTQYHPAREGKTAPDFETVTVQDHPAA